MTFCIIKTYKMLRLFKCNGRVHSCLWSPLERTTYVTTHIASYHNRLPCNDNAKVLHKNTPANTDITPVSVSNVLCVETSDLPENLANPQNLAGSERFFNLKWTAQQEEKYNTLATLLQNIQNKISAITKIAETEASKAIEDAKAAAAAKIAETRNAEISSEMAKRIECVNNRNSEYGFNLIDSEFHVNRMRNTLYNAFITNKNIRYGDPTIRYVLNDQFDEHVKNRIKQIEKQKTDYLNEIESYHKKIGQVLHKIDQLDEILERKIPTSLSKATVDDLPLLDAEYLSLHEQSKQ